MPASISKASDCRSNAADATESPLRDARWTRVVPHVVDTVFLVTGIWLAIRQGLVGYIILGSIALKVGSTRAIRAAAFVAALAVFAYLVGVARARHPGSWGLWLA